MMARMLCDSPDLLIAGMLRDDRKCCVITSLLCDSYRMLCDSHDAMEHLGCCVIARMLCDS
jgi:hypothetical protein